MTVLLLIAALSLAAWGYLALARDFYWRNDERLPPAPTPAAWPSITAVIPARDEAETIADIVAAHGRAHYDGDFTVTVIDDGSSDDTANLAASAPSDNRTVRVLAAPPLPEGWKGKLNAVAAGVRHAQAENTPDYYLLTDADIILGKKTLARLVAHAVTNKLALASLMARLDARGIWGGLLIPAFIYFFQQLYPFPAANDPTRRLAAAAGGVMLVRADALADAGGIEAVKNALIDDCALADLLKNAGERRPIWIGLAQGDEAVSLRDNRSLSSIWTMVARSAFAQLQHSWMLLAGAVLGMAVLYLAPPALVLFGLATGQSALAAIAGAAMIIMALTYFPTIRFYHQHPVFSFALPVAAFFYMLMTISSALNHARGRGGAWKGRTYAD